MDFKDIQLKLIKEKKKIEEIKKEIINILTKKIYVKYFFISQIYYKYNY